MNKRYGNTKKITAICIIVVFVIIMGCFILTKTSSTATPKVIITTEFVDEKEEDYYDCYVNINITSTEDISGIRFKLYHNKAFEIVEVEDNTRIRG